MRNYELLVDEFEVTFIFFADLFYLEKNSD